MTKETRFKTVVFIILLLLLALAGFSQKADTLYANNICYYQGQQHVGDTENKTQIIVSGDSLSFLNLQNDSVFVVVRKTVTLYKLFPDGDFAVKYSSSLKGNPVNLGLLYDKEKRIKSVSITDGSDDGFIFTIVPQEAVLKNKNL